MALLSKNNPIWTILDLGSAIFLVFLSLLGFIGIIDIYKTTLPITVF